MAPRVVLVLVIALNVGCGTLSQSHREVRAAGEILITPCPETVPGQQQRQIQKRLDSAPGAPTVFRFAPGDYLLANPAGLRVPGNATLLMEGARFLLADSIASDGQAFLIENASGVAMRGGEIVGARSAWAPSTNVAGVRVRGNVTDICIEELVCRDLSSNAIGIFGASDEAPIRNVVLSHVTAINCCNEYVDYLQPNKGPAPGSDREDQGTIALYYVNGWTVNACRFADSHSDGTHFFHSHDGAFSNSRVTGSRMGGYFLEGCERVTASGSLFLENGSRGVTIERDSRDCVMTACIIRHSGREGLWMPDVSSILVTGNLFIENGRKDDGEKDCEIRLDDTKEFATVTRDIRIQGNTLRTTAHQTAAIYVAPGIQGVECTDNTFVGPVPKTAGAS